ncbi:NAD(P)H-dependent oxidoreductase subunit E [Candidatus Micrarchaeota archaeon]|nr:NAD(P)H-dependent oxidoreductase subunit E [Candidatus Micrarchaeota archaeon]
MNTASSAIFMDESREADIIGRLLEVQKKNGWLPRKEVERIAKETRTPLAKVYGIATFYDFFSLNLHKKKEEIRKCLNHDCRLKGSEIIESS